jgi:nucleotide-binding universal stress UspA family protein
MRDIRRILVPTDLSPSATAAFRVARDVAERFEAELHIVHVRTEGGPFASFARLLGGEPDSLAAEQYEQNVRDQLEDYKSWYERSTLAQLKGAKAATEILSYAGDAGADLIVMGTHGHRSLDHPALGGTTGDVVRNAQIPVMTVRIPDDEEAWSGHFRHVLATVDFAEHSKSLLRTAKNLAVRFGASMSVVFVAEELRVPLFTDTGMMSVTTLKLDEEIVGRADEALRQLDNDTGTPVVETRYLVRHGNPEREIVAVAEEAEVDLIIVGRRGHSVHEGLLLGTVTEHVVRKSKCPVLTIVPGS